MIESRNDTLHNISKKYCIWSYVGAWKEPLFPHLGTFYIPEISNFSEEMLIKYNHQHPKINKFGMCISYMHF